LVGERFIRHMEDFPKRGGEKGTIDITDRGTGQVGTWSMRGGKE